MIDREVLGCVAAFLVIVFFIRRIKKEEEGEVSIIDLINEELSPKDD